MSLVRWGLLSSAKIARTQLVPAIHASTHGELVAMASRDPDRARRAADAMKIPRAYGSYEELLADPHVDAIYNPLPNHLHVPLSIQALEAGKHVLCEKPLGLNEADLKPLLKAARSHPKLKLMEAFMYRFHPQWQQVKDWIDEGVLGQVRSINVFFGYNNREEENIRNEPHYGGGGLMDIGCYAVSVARMIYEAEPLRLVANVQPLPGYEVDCLTSGIMEFADGTASFTVSTKTEADQWVEIYGEKGKVRLVWPFNPTPGEDTPVLLSCGGEREIDEFNEANHYQLMVDAFSKSILENTPVPLSLDDSLANMRVIDALFESGREGRWVDLD